MTEETHDLRYDRVDGDPNLAVLVATMDATTEWQAIRGLRAWERDGLGLEHGQRLLDVGCGPGDAALALAEDLGADGEVVGIDASAEMIAVARARAAAARCRVRFSVGDALALDEPDRAFDAVRSERTLQWLPDPQAAVVELGAGGAPGRIGLAHRHRLVDARHRRRRRRHRGKGPGCDADRARSTRLGREPPARARPNCGAGGACGHASDAYLGRMGSRRVSRAARVLLDDEPRRRPRRRRPTPTGGARPFRGDGSSGRPRRPLLDGAHDVRRRGASLNREGAAPTPRRGTDGCQRYRRHVRFAISMPQRFGDGAFDPGVFRAFVARAEALGFASIWTQEQVLGNFPQLAPTEIMTYAAACSEHIRIGCAVYVSSLHNPVHLAKSLSTLDQLSGGRLEIGVGAGGKHRPFAAFDADPATFIARFTEGVRLMQACWTEPEITFDGRFWQVREAGMEPKPFQKPFPPLWFGGGHPNALRRARAPRQRLLRRGLVDDGRVSPASERPADDPRRGRSRSHRVPGREAGVRPRRRRRAPAPNGS